jgi:hypothetical protein
VEREAGRRGLVAVVDGVRFGISPPLVLTGVRVEKAGTWSAVTDKIELGFRPGGGRLIGRVRVGLDHVKLSGAGGLTLDAVPSVWDLVPIQPSGFRAELREPVPGLDVVRLVSADGGRIEVHASEAPIGRLFAVRRDGLPLVDGGVVEGAAWVVSAPGSTTFELDLQGRGIRVPALSADVPAIPGRQAAFGPPTDVDVRLGGSWRTPEGALDLPRWHVTIDGAVVSGSVTVTGVPADPRLDLSIEVERADFARLLRTSGVGQAPRVAPRVGGTVPDADLGSASLSAHVAGRLADPDSFTVSQRLDFTPPRRPLPVLVRLRDDFVHEVVLTSGERSAILVSPASPDFIALHDVPPLFVRTLLLAEDSAFFGHRGIDLSEMPHAILRNWTRGGAARGASTITQQLAKNLFLSREKRLGRKLQELSLALLLESTLSKERTLEIYLNVIEWGPDLYGLRPAAARYFHRRPDELSPAQMALLVSLIPGPTKYQRSLASGAPSPAFRSLVHDLLAKLRSVDAITEEQYQAALVEELIVDTVPPPQPVLRTRLSVP